MIRKATLADVAAIMPVIDTARAYMRETGNTAQWTFGYPGLAAIENDIQKEAAYVLEHQNEIVGYFALYKGYQIEPTYEEIEAGNWLNDEPYAVIHRLASAGKIPGIAKAAFDFAFTTCRNVRVDTHKDNVPMKQFLQQHDFVYCGVIYVADGTPRLAFQKVI